jgi:Leucine-rich repeat (LRR) protein
LDLNVGGLQHLDVSYYENLEFLLLKGNRIKSPEAISGLSSLKRLRVLDLRKNLISKVEEVAAMITVIPSLVSVGLKGNPLCEKQGWRAKLLSLLPQLHEGYCELRLIDNEEITVLDIVKNWKGSSDTQPDRTRFQVIKLFKVKMPTHC